MFSSANPWHGFRPDVFLVMRRIDLEAAEHHKKAAMLAPRHGTIAVGGAHFDECLKRDALEAFLRAMRRGATPADAEAAALDESRALVRSWNRAPRCVPLAGGKSAVERWEDTCAAMLADVARRFTMGDPPAATHEPTEPPRQMVTGERLPYATRLRGRRV